MIINGKEEKALWFKDNVLTFIDQRKLPYEHDVFIADTVEKVAFAIRDMVVRGAPAIGAAAAFGMVIGKNNFEETAEILSQTRPTANDLFYAIDYMKKKINNGESAKQAAQNYVEDIISRCKKIGEHGNTLIKDGMTCLTHCNAGALATVDWGTALAPFRIAHRNGKKILFLLMKQDPAYKVC